MIVIKRDFVPEDTKSYYYNKRLTSGKAYFLKDKNENIYIMQVKIILINI